MKSTNEVFISYVSADRAIVERLVAALDTHEIPFWVDYLSLTPGARWRDEIRNAIQRGGAFLPCLSRSYFSRERTYMNEELITAVDEARLRQRDQSWLIPILLDESPIPSIPLGAGEFLTDIQAVDLHKDFDLGITRLAEALRSRL